MDPESQIREQLGDHERLLWSGQPLGGLRFHGTDIFFIPFSLMWGGFAFLWEFMVIRSGAPFFFRLWGIPFVLVGLYMIAGRFFWDQYQRANTIYGVTNQRILIVTRGLGGKIRSLNLRSLPGLTLSESSNGAGSIQFGANLWGMPTMPAGRWPGFPSLGFDLIADAKQVYETIRRAQSVAAG